MKAINRIFVLTFAVAAAFVFTAQAQTITGDISQVQMHRSIERSILKLPYYEVFDHIDYEVNGDTVVLSGKVYNGTNKKAAEHAVRRIAGVKNVVNRIEILPPGSFDDSIRLALYNSMLRTGGLSRYFQSVNPDIRLVVERGHVTLEGAVSNETDVNLARIAASTVPGVFSVTNNLVVDRRAG